MTQADQSPEDTGQAQVDMANHLTFRHRMAFVWRWVFQVSTIVGIFALTLLLYNILNSNFGYIIVEAKVDPLTLSASRQPLEELSKAALVTILKENISSGAFKTIERDKPIEQRDREDITRLIYERVVKPDVKATFSLTDSLKKKSEIEALAKEKYPKAQIVFRNWLTPRFLITPQASVPLYAGVRTALLGTIWTIAITILFAFPIGVGAAIYLEEYAIDNWLNRIIQTNINNLAGVPSIIYGMLGLAIFVRNLEPYTSGAILGAVEDPTTANGRTLISAGLTLALLVLPLIIINSQEAIRAVPKSLRQAAYGLGATKWQTVWHHVLPNAISGILTGTILSISRAIGETAPLVVVGASTFIVDDPSSPFSKFTTLPIQIYQWTARPQDDFRNIAAAAIVVLLVLLLTLNASAIILRSRFTRRLA